MKKLFLLSACLMVFPAMAQKYADCAYTPLQNLVINARTAEEIQGLISRGVAFDEQVRCGGSLTQLAIRRGNPDVLQAILQQDQKRANSMVGLDAFPIVGGPKRIPLVLFAAYYAPNKDMVQLLVAAGADLGVVDDQGRNILWYLDKNPVLKNTALVDELTKTLLYGMASKQAANGAGQPQGGSGAAAPTGQQQAAGGTAPQAGQAPQTGDLVDEQ